MNMRRFQKNGRVLLVILLGALFGCTDEAEAPTPTESDALGFNQEIVFSDIIQGDIPPNVDQLTTKDDGSGQVIADIAVDVAVDVPAMEEISDILTNLDADPCADDVCADAFTEDGVDSASLPDETTADAAAIDAENGDGGDGIANADAGEKCSGDQGKCDDSNVCTTDTCDPLTGCVHSANTLPCDDGDACSEFDACAASVCVGAAVDVTVLCDDGNACTADTCDKLKGCSHTNTTQLCEDGNLCTKGDTCANGACISGVNSCSCLADSDCVTSEDGDLCNGTLVCDNPGPNGLCIVAPASVVVCDAKANGPCGSNVCDKTTGKCAMAPKNDGKQCDADATLCTPNDVCAAGLCVAGALLDCDDKNPCSTDSCDAITGCKYAANTAPCSDGDACTLGDTCANNACTAGSPAACNDNNVCTTDSCDKVSGACVVVNNAIACDDNNKCSENDACAAGNCTGSPVNCGDGNACTSDSCNPASGCANTANSLPCSDGNACTTDVCKDGSCVGAAADPTVLCDDGNGCTVDLCDAVTGCTHADAVAACDDGNACTANDACTAGKCVGGANKCACATDADCAAQEDGNFCNGTLMCDKGALPFKCTVNPKTIVVCDTAGDTVCSETTCVLATGKCAANPVNGDGACDADGSACTVGDSCKAGLCKAGNALNCDDGNLCSDDSCDAKLGCAHKANVNPCSDGDACTVGDACSNNACAPGSAAVCNDNKACTTDSCNKATGACVFTNNAVPCDDANKCTQNDVCSAGVCSGAAFSCDDNNLCTSDSCSPASGCANVANTLPCSDSDPCTINDACVGGSCKGAATDPAVLCDDGNKCTNDTCNALTGCGHSNNTAPCDDGNACTVGDTCNSGKCASGVNTCDCAQDSDCKPKEDGNLCNGTLICDKGALPFQCKVNAATVVKCDTSGDGFCTANTCAPLTGACSMVAQNEAKGCDADKSVCTVGDACKSGACLPGAAVNCDDKNLCTDDACAPLSGCTHVGNANPCDDANPCTIGDVCKASACVAGAAKNCNDNNACTDDSCNAVTGGCVNANNTSACDDGNACTSGDKCAGGACAGVATSCNDGNACTDDSCDAKLGCVYKANSLPCNDSNACTTGDVCGSGVCGSTGSLNCNDGNTCTSDSCNIASGCVNVANAASCDDGNACTSGDVCSAKVCAGSAVVCSDANVCTSDSCNSLTGCVYTNNTLGCDDANACTSGDVCGGGSCKGAAVNVAVFCSDSNVCTTDTCAPLTGCAHANNSVACDDGNGCTTNDTCGGGVCVGGANTCACQQNSDCAKLEDGNFCNGTLVCDKGALPYKCAINPATIVTCDASGNTVCKQNTCAPATGACAFAAINPGGACNSDSSVCTNPDVCSGINCNAGAVLNCDDGNACTNDACDAVTGCTHVANAAACSDGNGCTVGDVCKSSACVAGPAKVCNDSNACTLDSCTPLAGNCVFDGAAVNGAGCNADSSVCTVADACNAGACVAGAALNCNDANVCTNDSCNAVSGCVHTANTVACNDSNACTGPDVCGGGACAPPALNCDDSNACTTDTCDKVTGCIHTNLADKTSCAATSICLTGVCTPGKCGDGVLMPLLGEACDDGNVISGDGCSATCVVEDPACADGTREGTITKASYPKIAQCNGGWKGKISATNGSNAPGLLCGASYHVCSSSAADQVLLKSITQPLAFQSGCWAIDASNNNGVCGACTDKTGGDAMAGIGTDCQGTIANPATSCISSGYRIDSTVAACSRKLATDYPWIVGVMCCAN